MINPHSVATRNTSSQDTTGTKSETGELRLKRAFLSLRKPNTQRQQHVEQPPRPRVQLNHSTSERPLSLSIQKKPQRPLLDVFITNDASNAFQIASKGKIESDGRVCDVDETDLWLNVQRAAKRPKTGESERPLIDTAVVEGTKSTRAVVEQVNEMCIHGENELLSNPVCPTNTPPSIASKEGSTDVKDWSATGIRRFGTSSQDSDASIATPTTRDASISTPLPIRKPTFPRYLRNGSAKGTDVFTQEEVRKWSDARLKAWMGRWNNAEGFYYRFVDPMELQSNGGFNAHDKRAFFARIAEFKKNNWRIGASWGIFSKAVPHKAGYQCSSFYRKCLEERQLMDPNYEWKDGKLVFIKASHSTGERDIVVHEGLSEYWESEDVKKLEERISGWLKKHHGKDCPSRPEIYPSQSSTKLTANRTSQPTIGSCDIEGTPEVGRNENLRPKLERKHATIVQDCAKSRCTEIDGADSDSNREKMRRRDLVARYARRVNEATHAGGSLAVKAKLHMTNVSAKQSSTFPGQSRPVLKTTHSAMGTKSRANCVSGTEATPKIQKAVQMDLSRFWRGIQPAKLELPDPVPTRIPRDVPDTWARRILALPIAEINSSEIMCCENSDICSLSPLDLLAAYGLPESADPQTELAIEGILLDPPWDGTFTPLEKGVSVEEVMNVLKKVVRTCMKSGMIFIWVAKSLVERVVKEMARIQCKYVENLVWCKLQLNNKIATEPNNYFRASKEILLMFKKGEGFEIRHQRTADVIMDHAPPLSAWIYDDVCEPKPTAVHEMIETLLPNASFDVERGRGRLLELWSKKLNRPRSGWMHIHQPLRSSAGTKCRSTTLAESDRANGELQARQDLHIVRSALGNASDVSASVLMLCRNVVMMGLSCRTSAGFEMEDTDSLILRSRDVMPRPEYELEGFLVPRRTQILRKPNLGH